MPDAYVEPNTSGVASQRAVVLATVRCMFMDGANPPSAVDVCAHCRALFPALPARDALKAAIAAGAVIPHGASGSHLRLPPPCTGEALREVLAAVHRTIGGSAMSEAVPYHTVRAAVMRESPKVVPTGEAWGTVAAMLRDAGMISIERRSNGRWIFVRPPAFGQS